MFKVGKIKSFIISNHAEIISVALLFVIFSFLMLIFGNRIGSVIVDCGREAYLPAEMLKGKILYKDIFNIFGPLSYQINTIFYSILGIKLNTLRLAGFINANLIVFLLYSITRLFLSRKISWVITLFIIVSCAFIPWVSNYIFPYSYAMVYAFSSFLFSVLFLLLYLKKTNGVFLALSWFFIGFSITSKYEYIFYALFLFILTILKMPKSKKYLIFSLIGFLITPLICFSALFIQGLNIQDALTNLSLVEKFAKTASLAFFYKETVGLYPSKTNAIYIWQTFINTVPYIICLLFSTYFFLKTDNKIKKLLFFAITCITVFMILSYSLKYTFFIFYWFPLLSSVGFITALIKLRDKINLKEVNEDTVYLIFFLISLLASIKTFFCLNLHAYGTYTLPLLLISNSIFVLKYIPLDFENIDRKILEESFVFVILILTISFVRFLLFALISNSSVYTDRGRIYNIKHLSGPTQNIIKFIEKNTKSNDSIWVLPEGVMINFLTNHPSSSPYYDLTPPYIETFREEKIITDTKKSPPNYIIINNRISQEYGYHKFCEDYGLKICNYIKSNYTEIKSYGDIFKLTIYKHKTALK